MQLTLLAWLVLDLTDSAWLVALVGFFLMVPQLILGLVGGVLADSVNRHRLIMSTQAASFFAALVMTWLLMGESESFWHAYLTILVIGIAWALDMPSRRSLVIDMVGRAAVTNAIALDSFGMSASRMLGPALGGLLIALVGVSGGYVVVTLFYLVSLTLVWKLRLSQAKRDTASSAGMAENLVMGLRYVMGHRALLATVLVTLLMNLLFFPYMNLVPVIARDVLHVGPGLMGLLLATDGLGASVGAIVIASAVNVRYHGWIYIGGSMVALLGLLLFSSSPWYALSLLTLLMLGFGAAGFITMQPTLVMLLAKEEMRGKALGVVSLAIGASPLGALFIGAVAGAASPADAIKLNAVLGIVGLVLIGLLMPVLRERTAPPEQR